METIQVNEQPRQMTASCAPSPECWAVPTFEILGVRLGATTGSHAPDVEKNLTWQESEISFSRIYLGRLP
jgi:hypothetical protein